MESSEPILATYREPNSYRSRLGSWAVNLLTLAENNTGPWQEQMQKPNHPLLWGRVHSPFALLAKTEVKKLEESY